MSRTKRSHTNPYNLGIMFPEDVLSYCKAPLGILHGKEKDNRMGDIDTRDHGVTEACQNVILLIC